MVISAGVETPVAQLLEVAAYFEPRAFVDYEATHPPVWGRGVGVGLGHQGEGVPVFRIGDEHLGAIDYVLLTVLDRHRLDGLDVAARVGFSEGQPSSHLPGRHRGEEALLLLLGAEVVDHVAHDVMGADDSAYAHPAFGKLLEYHGEGRVVQAHAAILFGARLSRRGPFLSSSR